MSSWPLAVSSVLTIGGAVVLAVAGLLVARRSFRLPRDVGENDIAGFLYAVIGVVYGVVLAFVVFVVWERFAAVDEAVTTEAADLVAVFRDTQTFPEPLRQQAQDSLRTYATEVTASEWASHSGAKPHRTPDLLNPVWAIYRQLRPTSAQEEAQREDQMERLHELERQRHLRHLAGESTLPPFFWPVLVIGGILTIAFSYFFVLETLWLQAAMTAVLTALITGILFLIFSLNQPFTGEVHVSQEPMRHALEQFNALNMQRP